MILRREFEDKLTNEWLKIVHYNLQISIRLSLFLKDVKVEQSFNSSGSLFHKLAALNINAHDCLILGNFKFLLLFFVSQPYHRAASLIAQKCPDLLNVVKEDGFSALHLASLNGHHNVVQCLVEVRKLTYCPCVRWNCVIWLKLSIFAHLASSCINILQKKNFWTRKEFHSHRTGLGHQYGRRFSFLDTNMAVLASWCENALL